MGSLGFSIDVKIPLEVFKHYAHLCYGETFYFLQFACCVLIRVLLWSEFCGKKGKDGGCWFSYFGKVYSELEMLAAYSETFMSIGILGHKHLCSAAQTRLE
jgi:hypothetical protein